jgi:hypothetical protein
MTKEQLKTTEKIVGRTAVYGTIGIHIEQVLSSNPNFTGKFELNFKDGKLMDISETKRTRIHN